MQHLQNYFLVQKQRRQRNTDVTFQLPELVDTSEEGSLEEESCPYTKTPLLFLHLFKDGKNKSEMSGWALPWSLQLPLYTGTCQG